MTTPAIPQTVDVLPKRGTPGFLTTDQMLILQRRGVTSTLEAVTSLGRVSVDRRAGEWLVRVANTAGYQEVRETTHARAIVAAAELAARLAGSPVRVSPFIAAHMYGWSAAEAIGDRIVSPLRYEPATDTVRIVGTNACAAVFEDGRFEGARNFDEDPGSEPARSYILEALRTGFHACDHDRGDSHCKRRLAWLAGALWLHRSPAPLTCGVLTLDMERKR